MEFVLFMLFKQGEIEGGIFPAANIQLVKDTMNMVFDGANFDDQLGRNLLVGQALGNQV